MLTITRVSRDEAGFSGRTEISPSAIFRSFRTRAPLPEISLSGHDTEHKTKNVCIEGVTKNGERLKKEEMDLRIGDFTEEISVV